MAAATFVHGDTGNVPVPVLTAQAVAKGDLVGLSSGNLVRAEDTAWDTDHATTQAAFVPIFLGAAAQAKAAAVARVPGNGSDNVIRVATKEVVEYDCASATFKVGDFVGPAKQSGNLLESQKVVAVALERLAIGRVFRAGTSVTRVRVELLSTVKPAARQSNAPAAAAAAFKQTIIIPVQLAELADAATWKIAVPFAFTVTAALFRTGKPASTGSKASTLTLSTTAGAVTGGVMALTTANQNATGGTVAATAISGANATGTAGQLIIVTPSSTTAFVEGDGWVEVTVTNNDLSGT